ncbi:MAG: hypothetical protein LUI39_13740 [Lachnospiraceae bacterium]|nr:hypothetical protein [Lachnospiraceae bacterium]
MPDNELIVKVQSSIGRQCYTHGYVAPVDVLMDAGVLDKRKYEDWRTGKIPYLESVCTCNLRQLSLIMKQIRRCAQEAGYRPSYCFYGRWGMKKKKDRSRRNVQPLRFSKSGNPKIERAYATHYVDGKRIAELKAEAERRKAEQMELDTGTDTDSGKFDVIIGKEHFNHG